MQTSKPWSLATLILAALVAAPASAGDWTAWRGQDAQGTSSESKLPLRWSKSENVKWRVPLPGPGNSTPIVLGDRIFVTQAIADKNLRALLCLDRESGKLLWQSGVTYTAEDPTHSTNPHASGSPATDGERIYVWFGSAGLLAYDLDGQELWRRDLGKQHHVWGYGASPVIHGDLVYLNFGPGDPSFLIAVNKLSGKTVWKHDYPGVRPPDDPSEEGRHGKGPKGEEPGNSGARNRDYYGSWDTPIVINSGEREELIAQLPTQVTAFDPKTGKILWYCRGLSDLVYTSALWGEGVIVAFGSFGGGSVAVRPGGSGDVTDTHRLWHIPRSRLRLGSGIIKDGYIYTTDIGGIAECLKLDSGESVWMGRLRGDAGRDAIWSSLVRNGDHLFVVNQSGETFVFEAKPEFEILGKNSLEEFVNASLVPAYGDWFIRTYDALWRIGAESDR